MKITSRFTIAIHMFACIDTFGDKRKITSDFLADSVNTNPVVIRKILGQLKSAGLINVKRGSGGCTSIAKPLEEITLLDIYRAVECLADGGLFHFHEEPNPDCPVGQNIHKILDSKLTDIQNAMEAEMAKYTLADVIADTRKCIAGEI